MLLSAIQKNGIFITLSFLCIFLLVVSKIVNKPAYAYMCVCVCVCVCAHIPIYIYTFIYTLTHVDAHIQCLRMYVNNIYIVCLCM